MSILVIMSLKKMMMKKEKPIGPLRLDEPSLLSEKIEEFGLGIILGLVKFIRVFVKCI